MYSYREDMNLIKFISDETALVQDIMQLEYLFSFEKGGQKEIKYEGKLWTAAHPDQFFTEWYLRKQPHLNLNFRIQQYSSELDLAIYW